MQFLEIKVFGMKKLSLFLVCLFLFSINNAFADGFGQIPIPRNAPTEDDERRNADLVGTGGIFLVTAAAIYAAYSRKKSKK